MKYTLLAIAHKNKPIQLSITSNVAERKAAWDEVNQKSNLLREIKCKPSDHTVQKMSYIELATADTYDDLVKIQFMVNYVNCRDKGLDGEYQSAYVDGQLVAATNNFHQYMSANRIKNSDLVAKNPLLHHYYWRVFG